MLLPNSINVTKEQNDNVTIQIDNKKSFNLLAESYLTKLINSVIVRGKDGSTLYEFFYTEVNKVIRKDGTTVSITNNDTLFDEFNQFFFFINNDTGGGGGLTNLPIGNFVFVNPLGNDSTGVREDFAFPFLTLNAAKNAAISGDTIYVYGGTYFEANTLHKEGVKWNFVGKPILNLFNANPWNDFGIQTRIDVAGNAVINHIGVGRTVATSNQNSEVYFDCESITGRGFQLLELWGGSGVININDFILCTLINSNIQLGYNANYVINVPTIINNATASVFSNCINLSQFQVYTGHTVINSHLITSGVANRGATIAGGNSSGITGTVVINVTDKIERLGFSASGSRNSVISQLDGTIIVNGNLEGGSGKALNTVAGASTGGLIHNGNAINDGSQPLVQHSGNSYIKMNGNYESPNAKVVNIQNVAKVTIDGNIKSTYNNLGNNYGLFITGAANNPIIGNLKIVSDLNGTPYGIGASPAKDIKIIHNVASNVDVDGNITNLITGTNYIFDTDVE